MMVWNHSFTVRLQECVSRFCYEPRADPFQILEQVEGGELTVKRGNQSRPKDAPSEARDLNAVEGLEAAIKLAQVMCPNLLCTVSYSHYNRPTSTK